ncbi:helix-turn-helix psq domain [Holotrichia oblita]|uniref:Helix-turn-helix psq domain n=1 Tax=Holotrichia oblita TaxID=644536 RepID=A0ACB9THV9_HOLOL|nr:helix-turn-helix psq domain [Holotrichia oblita]
MMLIKKKFQIKGDTKLTQYQHDVNIMVTYLEKYLVDEALIKEAIDHYENLFNRSQGHDINKIIASFYGVLRGDVTFFMYWPVLQTVDLFSGSKENDMHYLCAQFTQHSYKKDAEIIRCNDVQEYCYVVYKGKVSKNLDSRHQIESPTPGRYLRLLPDGENETDDNRDGDGTRRTAPYPRQWCGNDPSYNKDDIKVAVRAIKSGRMTIYKASRTYNIPYATIYSHTKGTRGMKKANKGRLTVLTQEQEEELAAGITTLEKWGFGLSKKEVLQMVADFVKENEIKTPFKEGVPGTDWFISFKNRHALSIKIPQSVEYARKKATDPFLIYG